MHRSPTLQCVLNSLLPMLYQSRLELSALSLQHGDTTVLLHCVAVAYYSLRLCRALRLSCDEGSLVRGALLHDYFLYDWHDPDPSHRLHGFHHAEKSLQNARQDFELTEKEADIILHHMFPLNPAPPRCREAVMVSIVDKGCSLYETLAKNTYRHLRLQIDNGICNLSEQ